MGDGGVWTKIDLVDPALIAVEIDLVGGASVDLTTRVQDGLGELIRLLKTKRIPLSARFLHSFSRGSAKSSRASDLIGGELHGYYQQRPN